MRLPHEEASLYRSNHAPTTGTAFGWGTAEHLLADLIDVVRENTYARAGKPLPAKRRYPKPTAPKPTTTPRRPITAGTPVQQLDLTRLVANIDA